METAKFNVTLTAFLELAEGGSGVKRIPRHEGPGRRMWEREYFFQVRQPRIADRHA